MAQGNPTHESRIQALEQHRLEDRKDIDVLEKAVKHHTTEIQRIRYWRDGNGAEGAEQRIQRLEGAAITEARTKELIEQSSRETADAVVKQMAIHGRHKFRDGATVVNVFLSVAVIVVMIIAL